MQHRIYVKNEQDKESYTPAMRSYIQAAIRDTLSYEEFEDNCEISVTLTDNENIKKLNAQYRNKDAETDVLSFPLHDFRNDEEPDEELNELGDIVINLERASQQAQEYGHSLRRETAFLAVHSTLHLLGLDHERSEEVDEFVCSLQDEIMKTFEIE